MLRRKIFTVYDYFACNLTFKIISFFLIYQLLLKVFTELFIKASVLRKYIINELVIISQGSLLHRNFKDWILSAWYFATSETGNMDGELFLKRFQSYFLPNCGRDRPVCLIIDNPERHMTLPLVENGDRKP